LPRAHQHYDDDRGPASGAAGRLIDATAAWRLVLAVRAAVDTEAAADTLAFSLRAGEVVPGTGWGRGAPLVVVDRAAGALTLGVEHLSREAAELINLFLGLALVPRAQGLATAVLGQTLDGYIATAAGESRCINGPAGLAHLHRLRALSDAVVVGATTAALDSPRLTTRLAEGPSPVRVVLDPNGRLPAASPLLRDGAAPTLVLRAGEGGEADERLTEQARVVRVPTGEGGELPPARVLEALRARGLARVLVEGGGDTVSRFLARGLLDRLQLLVAPVLLGAGRRAVRLCAPPERLAGALRPPGTQHLLGGDVLFDLHPGAR
jgi:riboflavin-specific deaminase-like protein